MNRTARRAATIAATLLLWRWMTTPRNTIPAPFRNVGRPR